MAYHANDFVNPNQRGVELPAGCKDLNEFLHKTGGQKRIARPIFPQVRGNLRDIPKYVERVYMEQYGLSLGVVIRPADAILWVHNRRTGPLLTFLLRKQHVLLAPLIQDLFGNG
jgi:hypothetical protein